VLIGFLDLPFQCHNHFAILWDSSTFSCLFFFFFFLLQPSIAAALHDHLTLSYSSPSGFISRPRESRCVTLVFGFFFPSCISMAFVIMDRPFFNVRLFGEKSC